MAEMDALMVARLAGFCTGILKCQGELSLEQAMDGMVESIRHTPTMWGHMPLDLESARCLTRAAKAAERDAAAHNHQVVVNQRQRKREAAEALRRAGMQRCGVCGETTANGKRGHPPKYHPQCRQESA